MTQSAPEDRYRIAFWTGEFEDPRTEQAFRDHTAAGAARQLQVALAIWAIGMMLFSFSDYQQLGLTPAYYFALAGRVATMLTLVGFALVLRRRPQLATHGGPLTAIEIFGFTLFLALYFLLPADGRIWLLAITVVLLIALFVFLPNRVILSSLVAVYALVGTLICYQLVRPLPPATLAALGLMLSLPATVGFAAAYRFQVVRRREYAALLRAEAANADLQREIDRRQALEQELQRQANTDPLTGLYNRRHYEALFDQELRRARRYHTPLALCVADLDHFKQVNDTYGHTAGDVALRVAARICLSGLRDPDIMGRLGGEEFVILLPNTSAADACRIADRLRERLQSADIVADNMRFRLTATFGVTELLPSDRTINDLVRRADDALYAGKRAGRNQVCAA
jgi:diguanylate cyclase (GGDEF)-like protein